jgi:hypothetical protein
MNKAFRSFLDWRFASNSSVQQTAAPSPNGKLVTSTLQILRLHTYKLQIKTLSNLSNTDIEFSPRKTFNVNGYSNTSVLETYYIPRQFLVPLEKGANTVSPLLS